MSRRAMDHRVRFQQAVVTAARSARDAQELWQRGAALQALGGALQDLDAAEQQAATEGPPDLWSQVSEAARREALDWCREVIDSGNIPHHDAPDDTYQDRKNFAEYLAERNGCLEERRRIKIALGPAQVSSELQRLKRVAEAAGALIATDDELRRRRLIQQLVGDDPELCELRESLIAALRAALRGDHGV